MSQQSPRDVLHSLDLMKRVANDKGVPAAGKCGGDCANCPCSGEEPKSIKKTSEQESSDHCEKC